MSRERFDHDLDSLQKIIVSMGESVITMTDIAVRASLQDDEAALQEVRMMDDELDVQEMEAINMIVSIIMREAPVASDLRLLTSTLSIVGELEKAGDDAEKLASRIAKVGENFPEDLMDALIGLSRMAQSNIESAIQLYLNYDNTLAEEILAADEDIDTAYKQARSEALKRISAQPNMTKALYRAIEVLHAVEHIADHAVEIAKRLRVHHYGQEVREQMLQQAALDA